MERGSYEELMWRVRNDRPSRDQFHPFAAAAGYLCEGLHLDDHSAVLVRPPMPEKRAKHPLYYCGPCWYDLPATQADVMRRTT